MALTETPICNFGDKPASFMLKGVDGKEYSFDDVRGERGTLVMFICNHCPYVKSIVKHLVADAQKMQHMGIGVIAINANDAEEYPEDSFDNMKKFAKEHGFTFPYVYDETQEIAKAYDAVCTPDFFGYNKDDELQYRGRFDARGKEEVPMSMHDLLIAMEMIAETGEGPADQYPSMGCNIKWKKK